ncbi:hypothetical protein [Quadrisphaera sp. INWT6]|uniref:hypothetical protein n=1 Tax=Quadrisphaera sp. INWT6 TaxID=2596917 RepID=UPI0018921EEE|nr:hypothetical protein [Quadrisphaera sp. INWT6]MBF5080771.1 hypothetical protein [Quadrisphaera sp. INWT6]
MESAFDARGTFAGYLLLDALIGNQDRHDSNWGVIEAPDGALSLAPTYDHGASLGFSLTNEGRQEIVDNTDMLEGYARRGRATKFEGRTKRLVTLVHEALASCGADVKQAWLGRLGDLTPDLIWEQVQAVPRMSDVARTFCRELLVTNRRRLLDVPD